jgi:hypothetical protein
MTLVGLAPGNLNIQNQAFPKGKSEELLRMFVARGTRPGTYAIYWNLQGPVPYRRNIFALQRAEREQAAAAKVAEEATTRAIAASVARDGAAKKHTACVAAIKPLQARLATLEQSLAMARRAATSATDRSAEPVDTATHVADFARKSAKEAEASAKAAAPNAQSELLARASVARRLADELGKDVDEAAASSPASGKAVSPAKRNGAEPRPDLKQLSGEIEQLKRKLADAEAGLKAADQTRQQAASLATAALTSSKQLADSRKAADARLAQAKQIAATKNLIDFAPSTPVILTVKTAPLELSASVPKSGQLKRGSRLDVKVKVRRARGFKGPVTLGLPIPPGVGGIKADPVTIPADKADGLLTIVAEQSATQGPVANLVVRGSADFEGHAEVDAPVSVKVVP